MTLLTIKYTVQHIAQLFGKPLTMALEQFNNLLATAQDELFKEFASGYQAGNGAEVDSRIEFALRPFRITRNYVSDSQSNDLLFSSTRVTLNTNDYKILAAYTAPSNTDPEDYTNIDIITPAELNARIGNSIVAPSADHPVMVVSMANSGDQYAYIIPKVTIFQSIKVMSLQKPSTPSLVLTYSNGIEAQSSSSVDLDFDSMFHIDIIRKILGYLGVAVGNPQIAQIVEETKTDER